MSLWLLLWCDNGFVCVQVFPGEAQEAFCSCVVMPCLSGCCFGVTMALCVRRYFLRKLKKVKKSNGQVLAINEVREY
jgi:hypothetical protein